MTSVPHSGAKSVTPGGSVAGHTQGPWVLGWNGGLTGPTTPSSAGPCAGGRGWGFQPVSKGMETVAICPNGSLGKEPDGRALANARLIVAAPDLLAVAIKSHEPYVGLDEEDIRCLYGADEADLAMALRDAIAKATEGETRNAEGRCDG